MANFYYIIHIYGTQYTNEELGRDTRQYLHDEKATFERIEELLKSGYELNIRPVKYT